MDAHQIANQLKALTFSFVQVGQHRFAPATQLPSRLHAFHSLHYIVGGKGSYTINGMRTLVQANRRLQPEALHRSSKDESGEGTARIFTTKEFYFSRLFKKTVGVAPSDYSKLLGQDRG
ncbi:MAG: hypothetical protein K0R75_3176 [Paenibacillaceae bacterium]|jgi:hypothetical protein|nr:hypothetical protein [Paenibacillaceae bacterium]